MFRKNAVCIYYDRFIYQQPCERRWLLSRKQWLLIVLAVVRVPQREPDWPAYFYPVKVTKQQNTEHHSRAPSRAAAVPRKGTPADHVGVRKFSYSESSPLWCIVAAKYKLSTLFSYFSSHWRRYRAPECSSGLWLVCTAVSAGWHITQSVLAR